MNPKIFLSTLLSIGYCFCLAQTPVTIFRPRAMSPAAAEVYARQLSAGLAQKPTATNERLVASSIVATGFGVVDSNDYWYSGTRTSLLSNVDFGSYSEYMITPDLTHYPFPYSNYPYNRLQYDSARHFTAGQSNTLHLAGRRLKSYDAAANMTQVTLKSYEEDGVTLTYHEKYILAYNAANAPVTVQHLVDTSAFLNVGPVPLTLVRMTYNASSVNRIADTFISLLSNQAIDRTLYHYNATGLNDTIRHQYRSGSSWKDTTRDIFVYDAMGRFVQHVYQRAAGTGWANEQLDSMKYTGTALLATRFAIYIWNGAGWDIDYVENRTLNAIQAADTIDVYGAFFSPTFELALRLTSTYNAAGNMTRQDLYVFNGTGFGAVPDQINSYYYVPTPTAVRDIHEAGIATTVYPNPATNTITISAAGASVVSIHDVAGRIILLQSGTATGSMMIDISQLSSGTYIAEMTSESGVQRVRFVKK